MGQDKFQEEEMRRINKTRSVLDWIRGIFFFLAGIFLIYYRFGQFRIMSNEPSNIHLAVGALFILYGLWRMYRGYKKEYFK